MNTILILTGPVASGKNTISHTFSTMREKCAVIDVDLVRYMYLQPHKAPWEGEEGKAQQELGVENACLLARNFARQHIDVIILDVITDETAKLYKTLLQEVKIVLLMPSFKESHKRFSERAHTISEDEFNMMYQWQEQLTIYDEKLDNTNMTPQETAKKLHKYFQ